VVRDSSEAEMIALFLLGELGSQRWGDGIRAALDAAGRTETLITAADHGLICLEGHLRLTAYALAGFPREVDCLIGTARTMDRWDH
jgi:hypothetical protein